MIRIWGRLNSSNVMKVLWLLDELALPHERIDAGLAFGRTETPEYRAMNPFRRVPVLQDETVTLFESNSILRYLCNVHAPDSPLYPRQPEARASVETWMDVQLGLLQPTFGTVYSQLIRLPPEQRDEAAVKRSLQDCADILAVFDGRLKDRHYLAADHLTLADVALGPLMHRWFGLPIARAETPALRRYYEMLRQRPAYAERCAVPLT